MEWRILKYQIPASGVQTHRKLVGERLAVVLKYQIPASGVQTWLSLTVAGSHSA